MASIFCFFKYFFLPKSLLKKKYLKKNNFYFLKNLIFLKKDIKKEKKDLNISKKKNLKTINYNTSFNKIKKKPKKITIVIDPGHGGQDPGAIGKKGLQEKKVNIAIALRLQKLLNKNKMFNIILTRKNDSYVSLKKRREFLKKQHVNLLISIHVDSSRKKYVSGASVWIVSKNRIHRESSDYLKKKSVIFFSKKIQKVLNENKNDFFLKKTILDFQVNNLQKIELDLSKYILKQLKKNIKLHKTDPNYASLEILSCINTPSILIETGFITNSKEEKKLATTYYQNKIADSIYLSLKNYFLDNF